MCVSVVDSMTRRDGRVRKWQRALREANLQVQDWVAMLQRGEADVEIFEENLIRLEQMVKTARGYLDNFHKQTNKSLEVLERKATKESPHLVPFCEFFLGS